MGRDNAVLGDQSRFLTDDYYAVRVTVDRLRLHEIAPEIELAPGMPAEVFIETGERTMLEYLMQPFLQSVERAFREK